MNSHKDDYLLKTNSKLSLLQASQFALIKLLFAYFKQPKKIFCLKWNRLLTHFLLFFKKFNFYGGGGCWISCIQHIGGLHMT